jgi:hypothetical protein
VLRFPIAAANGVRFPSASQGSRGLSLLQLRGMVRAEKGFAADRLQHTLLRRFRFQQRLKPGVRLPQKNQVVRMVFGCLMYRVDTV